jgi:hypothetical protein
VRSPPKRPGAIPTNATAAFTAPAPGTTRERQDTNAAHRTHESIELCNSANRACADFLAAAIKELTSDGN